MEEAGFMRKLKSLVLSILISPILIGSYVRGKKIEEGEKSSLVNKTISEFDGSSSLESSKNKKILEKQDKANSNITNFSGSVSDLKPEEKEKSVNQNETKNNVSNSFGSSSNLKSKEKKELTKQNKAGKAISSSPNSSNGSKSKKMRKPVKRNKGKKGFSDSSGLNSDLELKKKKESKIAKKSEREDLHAEEIRKLSRKQVIEDIEYLSKVVEENHISAINGLPEDFARQKNLETQNLPDEVNLIEEFRILCRLMSKLHDSHSMLTDFYKPSGELKKYFAKFLFTRLKSDIICGEKRFDIDLSPTISCGSLGKCKLLGVNELDGVSYYTLYERFKECFPHENDEWCRANFALGDGMYDAPRLALAGVDITKPLKARYNVFLKEKMDELRRKNEEYRKNIGENPPPNMINPFSEQEGKIAFTDKNNRKEKEWLSYNIDKNKNVGIFTLNECKYNKEYRGKVDEFFEEVLDNNIGNVVIDLRENTGGDSRVATYFAYNIGLRSELKFPKVEIRKGKEIVTVPPISVSAKEWEIASGKKRFFCGNVYILTSNKTFNSALMWAYIFRDNNLATIVGDIPGEAPTSFGDCTDEFETPNSKLKFKTTYKKFYRDYGESDKKYNQDKLIPDLKVPASEALERVYSDYIFCNV